MNDKGKIGILTFHCSDNYGAVLQAYALCKTIQKLSPDRIVEIIDYRCKGTMTIASIKALIKKKGVFGGLIHYPQIHKSHSKFEAFRKQRLTLSECIWDISELKEKVCDYDAFISGSDQVWNRNWSEGDDVYFQHFHSENAKKFSYAASFGFEVLPNENVNLYRNYLSQFNCISVRENSGLGIVQEQLGLKCERHIDPTLLLSKEEWSELANCHLHKGKYILLYMVPKQDSVIKEAELLSRKTGYKIVVLSKSFKPINVKHKGSSSPEEFVGWFSNAEYVVTNSFHGTVFSLIFHRKLYVDLNNIRGKNVRSRDLLELCGVNCGIKDGIIKLDCIDWANVDSKLNKERNKSFNYLESICKLCCH